MSNNLHISRPEPGIVLLEIDAPPRNALTPATCWAISDALKAVEYDLDVRVVILSGRHGFCAGADLKGMAAAGGTEDLQILGTVFDQLEALRVPVIAAVDGHSTGGGFELALSCDIRIASTNAFFVASGVNVGLMASVHRLPRLIGISAAKAVLLTGGKVNAETALSYGIVIEVCDPSVLISHALELAKQIATRAPLAVEAAKRMIPLGFSPDADRLFMEEVQRLQPTRDHREALEKFALGQKPVFDRS